jgi:sodium/hydrogen antiporter
VFVAVQLIVGLLALSAVLFPVLLRDRLMTYPLVVLAVGLLMPLVFPSVSFDLVEHVEVAEHLTEFAVIVALTGLGLSIDRPLSWRGWTSTWRLLAVTMPLSIAGAALLGWWLLGFVPATAVLLGAVFAPTDPVLAADVQTGPPSTGDADADEPDEVRFALTSESSLNDALAFPFTNLAIAMVGGMTAAAWSEFLLVDVAWKLVGGVAVGWLVGRLLGIVTLRLVRGVEERTGIAPALLTLGFTLVAYAIAELAHTYGFLAVFVSALMVRRAERTHHVHDTLHEGVEQLELMALSVVTLLLGAAIADGLWRDVTPTMVVAALLLLFAVRPAAGWVGLTGTTSLNRPERLVVAVFGIRGLGSLYYLAHGLHEAPFVGGEELWALTATTVVLSLVVHGLGAGPAMDWLDDRRPAPSS